MLKKKVDIFLNKYNKIEVLSFLIIFFVFMGSNFCKFTIYGIKLNFARILMIVPLVLLLFEFIKNKKIDININNNRVKYCIVFFIIWSIYSVLTFYKIEDHMYYIIMNFYICIGTINIIFFTKKIDIEKNHIVFFNIINFCVFINCLYYIYLFFIQNENIGGFYHNSNDLATVLVLSIASSIYLLFKYRKDKMNLFTQVIYLCVFVFSFLNITSRACIIGIIFAIIIMVMVLLRNHKDRILTNKFINILLVILLIIIFIIGVMFYAKYVGNISLKPVQNAQRSNDIRINLIYNGLYFLTEKGNLYTGIGAGNSTYYLENNSIYSTRNIYNFHNFWLEIMVEYGIIILMGFIIAYSIMLISLYKKGKNVFLDISTVYNFFWLAFIMASISSSTIITREWVWLTLALTISYINKEKGIIENQKEEE